VAADIPVALRVLVERDPQFAARMREVSDALQGLGRSGASVGDALRDGGGTEALAKLARQAESTETAVKATSKAADQVARGLKQAGDHGGGALKKVADEAGKTESAIGGVTAGLRRLADVESALKSRMDQKVSGGLLKSLASVNQATALQAAAPSQVAIRNPISAWGGLDSVQGEAAKQVKTTTVSMTDLVGVTKVFNATLEDSQQRYRETTQEAVEFGTRAGAVLLGAGAAVFALAGYAAQTAGKFEQLRAKLETVQHSAAKAAETFDFAKTLAAKTPFDVEGVTAAAVQLEVYGVRAQEVLPAVADMAAGMGKGIEETSLVVGKALSGSLEGFESLRNEYGVSTAKLAQFGAVMTSTGGISVATAADLAKARNALLAIIATNFGGAVDRQSATFQGAMSNAGDSVQNLVAAWGQDLVPVATMAAKGFSMVADFVGVIPGPMRVVASTTALVAAGVAAVGGASIIAAMQLVALNAQLDAASVKMPQLAVAANATGTAIEWMGAKASATKAFFVALATTPLGLALTSLTVVLGAANLAVSAYEEEQKKLGDRLVEESRRMQRLTTDWRSYWEARNNGGKPGEKPLAPGEEELPFNATPEQIRADVLRRSPLEVLQSLPPGEDENTLAEKLKNASDEAKKLRDELAAADNAHKALMSTGAMDIRRPDGPSIQRYAADARTPEQIRALQLQLRQAEQVEAAASATIEKIKGLSPAFQQAINDSQQLDGYLKFAEKAKDVKTLTEALGETKRVLEAMQKAAPKGVPAFDEGALRRRLLTVKPDSDEAKYIERLLTLMGEVESQSKRVNEANQKAIQDRLGLMDEEYEATQAGREQDLKANQAHLQAKLVAVQSAKSDRLRVMDEAFRKEHDGEKASAKEKAEFEREKSEVVRTFRAEETKVLNALHQNEEARQNKFLGKFQERVQSAIQGVQNLAASGDATSGQVADGYRNVLGFVDRWILQNQALLDQFPELKKKVNEIRENVQGQTNTAERTEDKDAVADVKKRGQEVLSEAQTPTEKLQAIRETISLYQTALRTEEAFHGRSAAATMARRDIQIEINNLKKQEVPLTQQIAEKERQAAQQMKSLRLQVLDQSISGLESLMGGEGIGSRLTAEQRASVVREVLRAETAEEIAAIEHRLAAGVKAEEALAEARHKRFEEALRLLEMERDAELAAVGATESDKALAHEKFLARKRMLDEAERQRVLQGLRKEVADVQQAEKDKQAARYAGERQARIGGEKSPILTPNEAFSYGLDLGSGVNLGDFATREKAYYGSKDARWASPEKDGADYWSDAAKRVAKASESAGQGLDKIPPAADRVDVSVTSLVDGFSALSTAAVQAAAALSTVNGGGNGGGGGGGETSSGVPAGTTTDGKQSFAPGAGPKGATPVDSSGYPVTPIGEGYPNLLERRIPTPVEMGAISPRVAMQPVVTPSRTVEQKNTFNIAPSSADPDIRTMEDAAARFMRRQERRQGLLAGGWR
jgi:hypothetical protein